MFFILSKILVVFIKPINWVAFFLLYATFGKKEKWKKRSLYTALLLFWIFTNHFLFNLAARAWEVNTITMEQIEQTYDIGILLGGYSNFRIVPNHDRHNFSERANRFNNALELYYEGKIKKILLTGGSGSLLKDEPSEAVLIREFLVQSGIPDSVIIVEGASKNTWENAKFTAEILEKDYPNASCMLITSAWHMRRSQGCFDKAGVSYTPFSTDHLGERVRLSPESFLLPDRQGFYRWEIIVKEMVGCFMYWIKGYL